MVKTIRFLLLLLLIFSLQSCGGGGDGGYITIDIDQQQNGINKNDNQDDEGDDENSPADNSILITPNENINSSRAYLYIDQISNEGIAHQSAACYGDYAFFISNKMIDVMVYNMRTSTKIFTLKQDPLGTGTIYHCNQACFGTQKYSEEDYFPLLYISQFQNSRNRCFITVFRVLPTSGGVDQEFVAFAFERIQTIFFPVATDDNSLNNVNAIIDADHRCIYTYSRNNNSAAENFRKCKISKFNIPHPIESSSVYLSDSDILDSFFIPLQALNMQGGAYHDGLLYIGRGSPAAGYVDLHVVDLANRKLWFSVDILKDRLFSYEPQGAYFYNGDLYIGASSRIFKFTFKFENSSSKAIAIPFDMPENKDAETIWQAN